MPGLGPHVPDEALPALLDPLPLGEPRRFAEHVRRCPLCSERLAELRRVKTLLRETAAGESAPERDLAPAALRRLRRRQTTISNINELLGALYAIVRGFGSLLAAEEAERREAPPRVRGPGETHG